MVRSTLARHRPTVTFLCSPNNPTGRVEDEDTVRAVLEAVEGIDGLLVVDEAYGQFAPWSALSLVAEDRPVVVTRTYSKTWSAAALRLGYLIGPTWVVEELEKVVLPYHLDELTQLAGELALDHEAEMHQRVARLVEERGRVGPRAGGAPGAAVAQRGQLHPVPAADQGRRRGVAGAGRPVGAGPQLLVVAGPGRLPAGHPGHARRRTTPSWPRSAPCWAELRRGPTGGWAR